ncbi:hypothetical protein [Kovacikia minuta]|uniref:hypothetical protein n=1 Tax=Kovacikia minuta TaxID=2931930 RepID=UPI0036F3C66B
MTEPGAYKDTVNLPQTGFDMRANAVKREPELQKFWAEQQIYQHLSQNNPGESVCAARRSPLCKWLSAYGTCHE